MLVKILGEIYETSLSMFVCENVATVSTTDTRAMMQKIRHGGRLNENNPPRRDVASPLWQ